MQFRSLESTAVEVQGQLFTVEIVEMPFREGVELRCFIGERELRVGDRGLGYQEAMRIMVEEIEESLPLA